MLKKVLAGIMCMLMAAGTLASCGNKGTETSGTSSSDTTQGDTTNAAEVENVDIANFTPPEKGDTIIVMKIKDYGTVKFRLFPEYADKGVENFVELAKKGYYDGLKFHRVIKDFMIQGGDPLGTGTGGESIWGEKFDGGTDPHLIHVAGALAYANSGGTDTNGSQFYVVTGTVPTDDDFEYYSQKGLEFSENAKEQYKKVGGAPWLDGGYTVFGQVIDGLDVIFKIQNVSVDQNSSMPFKDVVMESVTVGEYNGEDIHWYISDYEEFDADEIKNSTGMENVTISNFTAPKEGETIVSMKLKGYDGEVKIKLFPEYADKGVENFIELCKRGYYNGLTFHRIMKDFMIQGGDPNGDGTGGDSIFEKGYEGGTDPHLIHAAGAVAYANSGSTNTNGSQFYIVTGEVYGKDKIDELKSFGYSFTENQEEVYSTYGGAPWLDGDYTVFGQVFDGLDIVFDVQNVEVDENNNKPKKDVVIESMTVSEYNGEEVRWSISDYK
ncbi:peptidylprolyl isomerase [Ruminococcus flavefaciens]|uniref:peptidylprolyl isomerase n=1 Tax=Ruminococcus flavefaciens TaxID=1265 RepID=A0A1M7G6T5_RUMFL|nr:peptidylprolyl isomerase [Ruminococcus flavefaciens]SHM11855.1 Peptidyl-prolyl cis-trans isomerase (rotamase)-cyclophilin family [Ruminococcus flavefaciens]